MVEQAIDPLNATFSALGDPNAKDYSVRALATPAGSSLAALESRRKLLGRVDTAFSEVDVRNAELTGMNKSYEQAFEILRSERIRGAFEIDKETEALRERYGRNTFGQCCMLARRLVEAAVPLVQVKKKSISSSYSRSSPRMSAWVLATPAREWAMA